MSILLSYHYYYELELLFGLCGVAGVSIYCHSKNLKKNKIKIKKINNSKTFILIQVYITTLKNNNNNNNNNNNIVLHNF